METVAAPTDDEREDGEIVDDFEDISDYSIPSCGKSDYSQDILRAISLSSISDSGGEREYGKKHYLPPRKRHRCKGDHQRGKKKRRREVQHGSRKSRRSLSSSSSAGSDTDGEKLDKRTLRQLKEAVRINTSGELHHNSLRTRLKAMIDPDSQEEEDVEALRTLALLTKSDSPKPPDKLESDDALNDKELAELRSEALKSAVIKKHMERKKRKELDKKDNNNEVQTEVGSNDKENENTVQKDVIEEDVDVMRAMLLASISKRITSTPAKNPVCKPAVTSTPNLPAIKSRTALQNKQTNLKPVQTIKLPSVKPLIISLNSDSESDFDKSSSVNRPEATPIDETVTKLLKMHREKFEAKEKQSEQITNDDNGKDPLLDKSVVKLLSKSQQREYQLLKQKLLLANKRKVRRVSARAKTGLKEDGEEKSPPGGATNLKETLQELQFQKDGRLQMKGKYKELAPLIQKVNIASEKRKQCEEHIKGLLTKLRGARVEHAASHESFIGLVQKLKQAKENIDLRLSKMAKANSNAGTKPPPPPPPITALKKINLEPVKANSVVPILPKITPEVKTAAPQLVQNCMTTEEPAVVVNSIASTTEDVQNEEIIVETEIAAEVQKNERITDTDAIITAETVRVPADEAEVVTSVVEIRYSEYVSPLDKRNQITSNPLQMLCPYELFGTCRDQDCVFKHCP